MRVVISCLLVASTSTLIGCGGGGSSSSGGTVRVTAANAQSVAATATDGALGLIDLADQGDVFSARGENASQPKFDMRGFVRDQYDRLGLLDGDVRRARFEEREDCPGGGSVLEIWDDRDNSGELSPGDTYELQFFACREDDELVDGTIFIDDLSVTGAPGSENFSVGFRMRFDEFSVTEGTESATLNGSLSTSIGRAGNIVTFSLAVSATVDAGPHSFLGGTSIVLSENLVTTDYTIGASGSLTDVALGGSLSYSTPTPFAGTGEGYPSTGSMIVRGSDNTSVRVTAVDVEFARLEVDADGDGVIDVTITARWEDLIED